MFYVEKTHKNCNENAIFSSSYHSSVLSSEILIQIFSNFSIKPLTNSLNEGQIYRDITLETVYKRVENDIIFFIESLCKENQKIDGFLEMSLHCLQQAKKAISLADLKKTCLKYYAKIYPFIKSNISLIYQSEGQLKYFNLKNVPLGTDVLLEQAFQHDLEKQLLTLYMINKEFDQAHKLLEGISGDKESAYQIIANGYLHHKQYLDTKKYIKFIKGLSRKVLIQQRLIHALYEDGNLDECLKFIESSVEESEREGFYLQLLSKCNFNHDVQGFLKLLYLVDKEKAKDEVKEFVVKLASKNDLINAVTILSMDEKKFSKFYVLIVYELINCSFFDEVEYLVDQYLTGKNKEEACLYFYFLYFKKNEILSDIQLKKYIPYVKNAFLYKSLKACQYFMDNKFDQGLSLLSKTFDADSFISESESSIEHKQWIFEQCITILLSTLAKKDGIENIIERIEKYLHGKYHVGRIAEKLCQYYVSKRIFAIDFDMFKHLKDDVQEELYILIASNEIKCGDCHHSYNIALKSYSLKAVFLYHLSHFLNENQQYDQSFKLMQNHDLKAYSLKAKLNFFDHVLRNEPIEASAFYLSKVDVIEKELFVLIADRLMEKKNFALLPGLLKKVKKEEAFYQNIRIQNLFLVFKKVYKIDDSLP